jgi:sugar/nucleoside kinase (ribokinase family)
MKQIDFLAIGHVSCDLLPSGSQVGGTAFFSSRTAHVLGCRTAVLTSAAPDFELSDALSGISAHRVPSTRTTTFENVYTPQGRIQTLHARAKTLTPADIPADWRRSSIVHLAPIADEVTPEMIDAFSNSLVGLTPQGWLRRWDESGRVYAREWPDAQMVLSRAAAVILSEEDLLDDAMLQQYIQWSRLLILTQSAKGCTVFFGDETRQIPTLRVTEVEPTGAGDFFAAAFMIRLHETAGNPWEAARHANEIAAQSVTRANFAEKAAWIKEYHMKNR